MDQTDAFRLGIIDRQGKKIRDPKNPAEEAAYDMLWRLVIRLKRIINLVPVENKNFLSYAAAYALIRECQHEDDIPNDLDIRFAEKLLNLDEDKYYNGILEGLDFLELIEDGMGAGAIAGSAAPTNATSTIVNPIANTQQNIKDTITGVGKKARLRYFRRSRNLNSSSSTKN